MDALFPRCAGLDVHKANVIACVRIVGPDGKLTKHVRTFSTMTHALRELADWLSAQGGNPVSVHHSWEIRGKSGGEIRCQFIILARKDEPTLDYARSGPTRVKKIPVGTSD